MFRATGSDRGIVTMIGLAAVAALSACAGACAGPAGAGRTPEGDGTARIQILAINDFHGNLLPPTGEDEALGGVAFLAAHIQERRAENASTVVVSAGDLIGASPLVSSLFHDEGTVEAMNLLGLDIHGVGNHELDEGSEELRRVIKGGCHPKDGCQGSDPYTGARFVVLAANTIVRSTSAPLFPPYKIVKMDGVDVAFVGLTLRGTREVVPPVIDDLDFRDEAATVNAFVPELLAQGVKVIVVVVHEGGFAGGGANGCENASGPIVEIAHKLHPAVNVIASGHTHQTYNCRIEDKILTSAGCFGRYYTDVDLVVERSTGRILSSMAENKKVTHDVTPVAELDALVERYKVKASPLSDRVVGKLTAALTRRQNEAGESSLGNVIADAQRAATGAQLAFMNSGGIRTDLEAGDVTYGQMFGAQPFGNVLVTLKLTGGQILALLEGQWRGDSFRPLQVSDTLSYTWGASRPAGARVVPGSITVGGEPLDPNARYSVTVNDYMANHGIFVGITERVRGGIDLDAFEIYFSARSPMSPPPSTRIRRVD